MFQITADISTLTTEQRESVAAFILSFPQVNNPKIQVTDDLPNVIIPSFSAHSEEDEQSPEQAFSGHITLPAHTPILMVVPESADTTPRRNASPFPPATESNLDKNGIPWDERIHAGSRVKNADGSWRTKRGVDDALVSQVTSELKALMGIPAPPAAVPAPPVVAVPAPPVADTPAAAVDGRTSFITLIGKATALIGAKKLSQEELNSAVIAAGVPSLALLANRLDLVPTVSATIDAMVIGR